jgi:hypothetical protein
MNYKSLLTAILMAASSIAFAQKHAYIKFDTTYHDFGIIHEEDGKVVTKFNFTNTGNDTLKIITAPASCSCTTTDWTHKPIPPGGSGYVVADFNPYRHSGVTEKHVTVTTNAIDSVVILNFKVTTIGRAKTFNDSFPERKGNLYFGDKQFNLKTMYIDQVKPDTMEIYNISNKPMKLSFANLPAHITATVSSETIAPLTRGKIFITYNASKKNDYGTLSDTIILTTDDNLIPSKQLIVAATITDDFAKLTREQKDNAPKISFTSKETQDFGVVNEGEKVKVSFDFKNEGKSPLIIRKAAPGREDCKITVSKSTVEAGGTGSINIEFDTKGVRGVDTRRTILLTTNDPQYSFKILIIKGNITSKQ